MRMPSITLPKLNFRLLKPLFTENLGLKIFSLACAFVIYAFVHSTQEAQRNMAVDLVALLPPETAHRILVTPLPPTVRVTLHGPRTLLDGLHPEDLGTFQVDLRTGRTGRIPLEPSMLGVPAGTTISLIDPAALDIVWDDLIEREIPVQVSVTGDPADGFLVKGPPEINPRTLHARGARQVLETMQAVRSEPFDVTGLAEGTHQRVLAFDHPPPRVAYDVLTTTVTVEVSRKLMERTFRAAQVHVVGSAHAVAFPPRVDVRVVGPPDIVKPLRQEQIVPRIDLKELGANVTAPNSMAIPITFDVEGCKTYITPTTVVVKW
ncbi:MAG: YbbR-like domain-containing protein [Deltaproteobacteria bacterium]|nr:YbbR-like domain-containing protein [Deltaproteobacteria bacterium]